MSKYKVIKYEGEIAQGTGKPCIVAFIAKEGEEQPFRIMCENVSEAEEARVMVESWISNAEHEDAVALANYENDLKETEASQALSGLLGELNGELEADV